MSVGSGCAVAAGTPLAALAGLARLGGPSFSLRDYGRCGSSARNSGQLFVYRLGGETNRGQDGWEYKVGRVSGTTGAADTSGPLGNGRLLASGERVLWFWCQASPGGCQRTLEVSAPSSVTPSAGRCAVQVTGYDNEGRGTAGGGRDRHARQRLRLDQLRRPGDAVRSQRRRALLAERQAGRRWCPSFPETIVVR